MTIDKKIVVICGGDNILSASIQNNLEIQEGWCVLYIPTLQELEDRVRGGDIDQPAIIIIVHQESHFCPSSNHLKLLQDHSGLKLVAVSLENNIMEVYNKQKVLIRNASDFIHIIQEESTQC